MSKAANSSKNGTSGKESPTIGGGYREIGIAAVAAALRCQHMPAPADERGARPTADPSCSDRLR